MTDSADEADLKLAHELADLAANLTLPAWRSPLSLRTKDDGTIVTDIDIAVDEVLTSTLSTRRPNDVVQSEELSPGAQSGAGRRWYIDPLDQTVNYTRGLPEFATLIALYVDDSAVCAVISAPAMRERWWAIRGRGARNTSGRLSVSNTSEIRNALASIAAPHRFNLLEHESSTTLTLSEHVLAFAANCRSTTGSGGFLGHMRVAEGKIDLALDPWGETWDLAASALIVRESGGAFTSVTGQPSIHLRSAIASNGRLHTETLERITTHP